MDHNFQNRKTILARKSSKKWANLSYSAMMLGCENLDSRETLSLPCWNTDFNDFLMSKEYGLTDLHTIYSSCLHWDWVEITEEWLVYNITL